MNNEIVIYQSNELTERIEVRLKMKPFGLTGNSWHYFLVGI